MSGPPLTAPFPAVLALLVARAAQAQEPAAAAPPPPRQQRLPRLHQVNSRAALPDRNGRHRRALCGSSRPRQQLAALFREARGEQAKHDVTAEEGRYPYVFQADAGYTRAPHRASTRTTRCAPAPRARTPSGRRSAAPSRTAPSAELRVQGERFENDAETSELGGINSNSGYGTSARATLTQPFLRGAGTRARRVRAPPARWNRTLAEALPDARRERVRPRRARRYWELWYAGEALAIDQKALGASERQAEEARQQVAAGAFLAERRPDLRDTRRRTRGVGGARPRSPASNGALELGRLMGSNDERGGRPCGLLRAAARRAEREPGRSSKPLPPEVRSSSRRCKRRSRWQRRQRGGRRWRNSRPRARSARRTSRLRASASNCTEPPRAPDS